MTLDLTRCSELPSGRDVPLGLCPGEDRADGPGLPGTVQSPLPQVISSNGLHVSGCIDQGVPSPLPPFWVCRSIDPHLGLSPCLHGCTRASHQRRLNIIAIWSRPTSDLVRHRHKLGPLALLLGLGLAAGRWRGRRDVGLVQPGHEAPVHHRLVELVPVVLVEHAGAMLGMDGGAPHSPRPPKSSPSRSMSSASWSMESRTWVINPARLLLRIIGWGQGV